MNTPQEIRLSVSEARMFGNARPPARLVVMSACHLHEGEWIPEEGSPAAINRTIELTRLRTKVAKIHWRHSRCVKTRWNGWAWEVRDRCLEGDKFDQVPQEERCSHCDFEFNEA